MDNLTLDKDGYAIPFNEVKRLLDLWSVGHRFRVAFTMIALTGCRISELENMGLNSLLGEFIIWKTGKNQTGYRKERLPLWFLEELQIYRDSWPCTGKRLFPFKAAYLRDILNKEAREKLKGDWLKKEPTPTCNGPVKMQYLYQLKGLRHNFATLDFYNNFVKWGGTVAVEFTCKRMRHSSYKMTAGHYIGNFERLSIQSFQGLTMQEIIKQSSQLRLNEFL